MNRLLIDRKSSFFMVERRRQGEELREEFDILGSTGNVSADVLILCLYWRLGASVFTRSIQLL
jgi:hypothetical protein